MLLHYIKVAWRNIWRYKILSVISIVGLAVGLFSFSLCAYLFRYWLAEDEGFRNHRQVVEMVMFDEGDMWSGTPAGLAPEMRERNFSGVERLSTVTYTREEILTFERTDGKEVVFEIGMTEVDSNFMTVFGCRLLKGDSRQVYTQPNALVLTESCVRKIFRDQDPIGSKVSSPDGQIYTIYGIIEDMPVNNSLTKTPLEAFAFSMQNGRLSDHAWQGRTGCMTFALLRPDVSVDQFNRQIEATGYRHDNYTFVAYPLGKIKNPMFFLLYGLTLFIGGLVLLSALLNYFSFVTGTFFNRMKELRIRKGLGQNGRNVFGLLFTELCLSLVLAGGIALCLTEVLVSGWKFNFFYVQIGFDVALLLQQIGQYLIGCIGVAALVCLFFCWRLHRVGIQAGIQNGGGRGNKHGVRNILLGVQFFICMLFLSAGGVAYMQSRMGEKAMFETLTKEEKERIFFVRLDYPLLEKYHSVVIDKLRADSRVEDILRIESGLMSYQRTSVDWGGNDQYMECFFLCVSDNFVSFLHLPVLQGEGKVTQQALLIDEQLAKRLEDAPIGQLLDVHLFEGKRAVSGVLSSIYRWPDAGGQMLVVLPVGDGGNCYVKAVPGKVDETLLFVRNTLEEFLPEGIPVEIFSLQEECARVQTFEIILRNVFLFFGIVCLIITLLGVYSAITLDTVRRQKEVAIRKINGAGTQTIVFLFVRLYGVLLLIGAFLAFPVVWFGADAVLMSWPVHFNYNNPWFWLLILAGLAVIIGLTIFAKIVGIVRSNPAEVLKRE